MDQAKRIHQLKETSSPITHRGFTGQEEVEPVGLIHMNGRMYDPILGRFLSADPYVQAPDNSQSLNRYSYGLNNPLAFTDPTGFWNLGHWLEDAFSHGWVRIAIGVVVGVILSFTGIGVLVGALIGALLTAGIGVAEGIPLGQAAFEGAVTFAMVCGIHAGISSIAAHASNQSIAVAGFDKALGVTSSAVADSNVGDVSVAAVPSLNAHDKPGGGEQTDQGKDYADTSFNQTTQETDPYSDTESDAQSLFQ